VGSTIPIPSSAARVAGASGKASNVETAVGTGAVEGPDASGAAGATGAVGAAGLDGELDRGCVADRAGATDRGAAADGAGAVDLGAGAGVAGEAGALHLDPGVEGRAAVGGAEPKADRNVVDRAFSVRCDCDKRRFSSPRRRTAAQGLLV
jgi:hypothetical protein